MTTVKPKQTPFSYQRGMSMLEVLVAIVILGLGALGIAALQARALKGNESSMQRTQAVIAANYLLDGIRSGYIAQENGNMTCNGGNGGFATWLGELQSNMGGTACGQVQCAANANPANTTLCTVTIQWDDSRVRGGSNSQTLQLSTLL